MFSTTACHAGINQFLLMIYQ